MEWRDHGVILSVRRHGETSAIAELLTPEHGRCLGLVRGGRSRIQRPGPAARKFCDGNVAGEA